MSSPLPRARPHPPGIYRAARALRRIGTIITVLVIVFVGVVAFSAVQVVRDHPQVGQSTSALEPNGTVGLATSLALSNPGYVPIQSFQLQFRITNATGGLLAADSTPVTTIGAQAAATVPIELYVPVSASDESLLTTDQNLTWHVWGNATVGYLFPVSLGISANKSWGAPFSDLAFSVGTPVMVGGTLEVPVQLSFDNDASFADAGDLEFQVVSSGGATCSTGSFDLNVAAGAAYSNTQNVPVATGCDPAGGQVDAEYLEGGTTIPLPPQAIP